MSPGGNNGSASQLGHSAHSTHDRSRAPSTGRTVSFSGPSHDGHSQSEIGLVPHEPPPSRHLIGRIPAHRLGNIAHRCDNRVRLSGLEGGGRGRSVGSRSRSSKRYSKHAAREAQAWRSSHDRAAIQPLVEICAAPADGLGAKLERLGELASLAPAVDCGAAQADISGGFAWSQHLGLRFGSGVRRHGYLRARGQTLGWSWMGALRWVSVGLADARKCWPFRRMLLLSGWFTAGSPRPQPPDRLFGARPMTLPGGVGRSWPFLAVVGRGLGRTPADLTKSGSCACDRSRAWADGVRSASLLRCLGRFDQASIAGQPVLDPGTPGASGRDVGAWPLAGPRPMPLCDVAGMADSTILGTAGSATNSRALTPPDAREVSTRVAATGFEASEVLDGQ